MAEATPPSSESVDEQAKRAIDIMFTQGVDQAEQFLVDLPSRGTGDLDLKLKCTIGYVRFVKALMTWDEDVIDETIKFVKSVEKSAETQSKGSAVKKSDQISGGIVESDCTLIRGMLTFTRMTIPSYIKAGFHLRSASKGYEKMLKEVEKLEPKRVEEQIKSMKKPNEGVVSALNEASQNYVKLKASVTMGFGLLNLIMSLIPDKILVIIKLFGFSANREAALKALDYCSQTRDMRSPIAKLVLLWHHTITRPSFGLDGDNLIAGVGEAQAIMAQASSIYHDSPLFLYFEGRIAYLRRDTGKALSAFKESVSRAQDQREIKHVNLYEIGFVHVTNLEWKEAADAFLILKSETRWSVGYYSYLYALSLAASGDVTAAEAEFRNIPSVIKHKNSNYEKYVLRRSQLHLKMGGLKDFEAALFALQLAYQWSQISYLNDDQCLKLLKTVQSFKSRATTPLIEAVCLQLQGVFLMQMLQYEEAEKYFRCVLEKAKDCVIRKEQQAPAFATYEIGRIYFKRGEVEKAKVALAKAKSNYSDYEVESRLQAKVQSLLLFIKKGGRSSSSSPPPPPPIDKEETGSNEAFEEDDHHHHHQTVANDQKND